MRKLVITLFCVALLIPSRGNTLGLGEIELHSSLNEELNAEIALTSVGQESAETIIVKLASKAEFDRAGIDRPFILTDLKFTVKIKNDKPYIEVTSKKSIREPFLSFLLDIDWPRGHILREFTMLLDPPVFMQASAAGVPTKPVVSAQSGDSSGSAEQAFNRPGYEPSASTNNQAAMRTSDAGAASARSQIEPQQTAHQQPARAAASYQTSADSYRVQANDTAWKIANRLSAGKNVSIEQMMMALLRRNPEAFIQDNINGLKRGYILRIPDQQEIAALKNQTALIQVKEQYALWREYRQSVTARRNANKIDRDAKSSQAKPALEKKGYLKITSAAEAEASDGVTSGRQSPDAELKQLRQDLATTAEELESGKLENKDLKERVSSLQSRMKKMQRLLNLKDSDLANLQSDLSSESVDAAADLSALEKAAQVSPPAVDLMTEEKIAAEPESVMPAEFPVANEQADGSDQAAADAAADAALDAASPAQPAEDAVFMDEMAAQEQQSLPVPPVAVAPPASLNINDLKNADFIEKLLNDPNSLPLIIGIPAVFLLLVLAVMIRSRRKKAKKTEEVVASLLETGDFNFTDMPDNDTEFADQPDEDLGEQLEAYAEEADANSDLGDDVISLEDDQPAEEAPKDDVLAEADVYLAYGIYQQAEELLKTAVAENPDRVDYKVKLLETFFASKDKSNYVSLAAEMQSQLNPESPEWQRVVAMGRELDPANELFSGVGDIASFDVDDLLPEKPETDFDLGVAAADFDLGDAIDDDGDFDLDMDDASLDDIETTVALSAEDIAAFDLIDATTENADNFALNDAGLDELDQELASAQAESEPALVVEDIDDDFSLDFEMADLGLDEATAEISAEETELVASAMQPETEDFGLNLTDDQAPTEFLDNSDDLELDLSELSESIDTDVSIDDISLDMGDIDLDGIDLTMDDDDETVSRAAIQEDDEAIDISRLPDDLDEVNTKLDLARAYIDMGDNDGASSILREVVDEAAGEQKETAESLLKNIA